MRLKVCISCELIFRAEGSAIDLAVAPMHDSARGTAFPQIGSGAQTGQHKIAAHTLAHAQHLRLATLALLCGLLGLLQAAPVSGSSLCCCYSELRRLLPC